MPSRSEIKPEDASRGEIKIPTPKRFSTSGAQPAGPVAAPSQGSAVSAKPDRVALTGKKPKGRPENKNTDSPIFEGGSEISRIKLEHKMKLDPKVWQAGRQEGLNLSPVERAKLVKEVFSSAYGRNISKNDLRLSIRKLNQKMLGTKDSKEHAKIRKEIKFFKKIGGIR